MEIIAEKKALRRAMKTKRDTLPLEYKLTYDTWICNALEPLLSGNKTKQITPGKIKKGKSKVLSQPVKFAPNCPCFKFFAPRIDFTIVCSIRLDFRMLLRSQAESL
jgi:hypothetical protein